MKILIVNISDTQGGASRAAYRLHKSLLAEDIESEMLVAHKYGDDFSVRSLNQSKKQKGLNLLRPTIDNVSVSFYKHRTQTTFTPATIGFAGIIKEINKISPDIVHLHWVGAGMIKLEDLSKINVPIVWSLHDMWAFTGGCHYDDGCQAYEKNCGACIVLGSNKENDLSKKIYHRKKKVFAKINNMTIIGLSKWLSDCAKKSTLLEDKNHIHLPNPIDTNFFKPFDKYKARELWGLPKNKKLVLFGAMGATSDPRKGFKELTQTLHELTDENIELVIFGSSEPKVSQNFGLKIHYVGKLSDDISLITLYNAVDVAVIPSLQENLSNVIMESLACGTPVVGFNIGGNSDMIEHKINGYLAKPFEAYDLANGIKWVLDSEDYEKLRQASRDKTVQEFDSVVVANKYIKLYKDLLND